MHRVYGLVNDWCSAVIDATTRTHSQGIDQYLVRQRVTNKEYAGYGGLLLHTGKPFKLGLTQAVDGKQQDIGTVCCAKGICLLHQ